MCGPPLYVLTTINEWRNRCCHVHPWSETKTFHHFTSEFVFFSLDRTCCSPWPCIAVKMPLRGVLLRVCLMPCTTWKPPLPPRIRHRVAQVRCTTNLWNLWYTAGFCWDDDTLWILLVNLVLVQRTWLPFYVCGLSTTAMWERAIVYRSLAAIFLLESPLLEYFSLHLQWPHGEVQFLWQLRTLVHFPVLMDLLLLRYDGICVELQLLLCMTYRLSVPIPPRGGVWIVSLLRQ